MNDLIFTNAGDFTCPAKALALLQVYITIHESNPVARRNTETHRKVYKLVWLNRQTKDVAEQRLWDTLV